MQNIPRWKKSDRGSSHFRHGLDPRLLSIVVAIKSFFEQEYRAGIAFNNVQYILILHKMFNT